MNDMVSLELALAYLYESCGDQFPEEKNFWLAIKRQEELHAKLIKELAALISSHPQEFNFGRPFDSAAVKSLLSRIVTVTATVRKGLLTSKRALFMAKNIENSLLEANYSDIVDTGNVEFRKIIERITKDTLSHKNLFAAKVAKSDV
jgi:hypothetical protein